MKISHEKISKGLALLILATSFLFARHVLWVVTNPDNYKSVVGAIWIVGVVPFFIVVFGCALFLMNKRYGLALIVVGSILSFFGGAWSYIPYLPALSADPVARTILLVVGNLAVLAMLFWSSRKWNSDGVVAESRLPDDR